MMEGALMTELITRSEVSRSVRAMEAVSKVDKLGRRFLLRSPYMISNLGDWRVSNDRKAEHRSISFSKGKEKQHLIVRYNQQENRENTGFDFTMSDGKTVVSLQKVNGENWRISRKGTDGKIIEGDTDLSRKELTEIKNFIRKFNIDRVVNGIVDTVDSAHILRYIAPPLLALYGVGEIKADIIDYVNKVSATQQEEHTQIVRPEKNNTYVIHALDSKRTSEFNNEIISARDNFYKTDPKDHLFHMQTLGLIEDMRMTTLFFSQPQLTNGRDFTNTIGKYLLTDKDVHGLYRWRPYEQSGEVKNTLIKPLREVLKTIREENKNPQNQKNYFRVLDAFMNFKGQSIVTPEKIMTQLGQTGDYSYVDGKQLLKDLSSFNDGPIKAYKAYLLTVNPGELLVTENGQIGIVMNVTKDNKVVVMIVDAKGQTRRVEYNENNFPNSVVFRYGD